MEELYQTWEDTFSWGADISFTHVPKHYNEALVNGGGLRSVGRSTAVEFWRQRDEGNFVRLHRQTGPTELGQLAHTTFHVMSSQQVGEIMPASAVVSEEDATHIVELLISEGPRLEKLLVDTGIVSGDPGTPEWQVNLEALTHLLHNHCVVMEGHLPTAYWPRYRRATGELRQTIVCTCLEFCQHAECEHQVFVLGLRGGAGAPVLADAPLVRKKGRKRKDCSQ